MRIEPAQILFDDVDGEPVCATCGSSLISEVRLDGLAVLCASANCPNHEQPLLERADDQVVVTRTLLYLKYTRQSDETHSIAT